MTRRHFRGLWRIWAALSVACMALTMPARAELTDEVPERPQVFIASDSTAQSYPQYFYPQTGWGQMLQCAFDNDVVVRNHAMGGRSTRTFIEEGRWDRIMREMNPGDVVLVQFAHNDANKAIESRYAAPRGYYRDALLRFIWQVRGAGGTPVLITPIAQRVFDDKGRARVSFPEYSEVVRELGVSQDVPVIDLETLSRQWIDDAGAERAKAFYLHLTADQGYKAFPRGIDDDTHLSELGARGAANLVARAYRALRLPHWSNVNVDTPALTRTEPLGKRGCS